MGSRGFTLIELLVTVVVLGILAGVSYALIDPRMQLKMANENVMYSNLVQICVGVSTCQNAKAGFDSSRCNTFTKSDVKSPTSPTGATYVFTDSAANRTAASGYVRVTATLDSCQLLCQVNNDFSAWTYNLKTYNSGQVALGSGCVAK